MQPTIGVEALRPVRVLYEGDVHDLAVLLLKLYDARAGQTGYKSQPTVHGLASAYARLMTDPGVEQVEAVLRECGLPLGAIIEWADGSP
jgi:hypothetical protein